MQPPLTTQFSLYPENKEIGIIHISGAIDLSNVDYFSTFLDKVLANACKVLIFNLKGLVYMNSTGFGALTSRAMDENISRRIIFCNLEKNVVEVFSLFGLDNLCEIFPDLQTAVNASNGKKGSTRREPEKSVLPSNLTAVASTGEVVPTPVPAKEKEEKSVFPLVKPCTQCGKKINFRKVGHYKCPHCNTIHYIDKDGKLNAILDPLAPTLPIVPQQNELPDEIEISLPSDPHYLGKIRDFIVSFTRDGFAEEDRANIAMAVDEACTNAIEHAHKFDRKKRLHMSLYSDQDKFSITIKDGGENTFTDPSTLGNPATKKSGRGMGLFLMKKMMDDVQIKRTEKGGTAITLVKRCKKN